MPTIMRSNDTVTVKETAHHAKARTVSSKVTAKQGWSGGSPYDGAYTVTPSEETQTLGTSSRLLSQDVVINPIPSNYGLITYDGSVIRVS